MSETQSIARTLGFGRSGVKDITPDLLERLEAANAEMAAVRTEYDVRRRELEREFNVLLESIGSRQRALGTLLDAEMTAFGEPPKRRAPSASPLRLPLAEFILHCIGADGDRTKDDIRESVERAGYVAQNETAGRMVHTTLLNLVRAGRLTQDGDHYSLPPLLMVGNRNGYKYSQAAMAHAIEDDNEARAEEARMEEDSSAETDEPPF